MSPKRLTLDCIDWIAAWFEANAKGKKAVLGMSGGKDSTVAAALCAKALGPENVVGVAMPGTNQGLNEADKICEYLGIQFLNIDISKIESEARKSGEVLGGYSSQGVLNIPPRLRMTVLYAVAQSVDGIVANTCNLSEDYIGYATLYGDAAGSFSPLSKLCVREVRSIGHYLGIPSQWVDKIPDDGLPNSQPDEQKFGFSYDTLDAYIRDGVSPADPEVKRKIDRMHATNLFKTQILHIPAFDPNVSALDERNAILITHGTDTLAWTHAALRYALKGNNLNIAITGSQIRMPGGVGDFSDAYANIDSSIRFLSSFVPPKIFTVFNNGRDAFKDSLYKVDRWDNKAFGGDVLGTIDSGEVTSSSTSLEKRRLEKLFVITTGGTIESDYNSEGVLSPSQDRLQAYIRSRFDGEIEFKQAYTIDSSDLTLERVKAVVEKVEECMKEIDPSNDISLDWSFDPNVRVIYTDPFKTVDQYLLEVKGASAVILAGYGSGNINIQTLSGYSPLELIRSMSSEVPFVLTSQVALGAADFAYDNSWQALKAGAISGVHLSIPEIQVRMSYILGHKDEIKAAAGDKAMKVVEWLFMSGVKFRSQKSRDMYEKLRNIRFSPEDELADKQFKVSLNKALNEI